MNELADILGVKFPDGIKICHATNNSKRVKENSIFFALKGKNHHGSKYIEEALECGAPIVVHNDKNFKSDDKKVIYIKDLDAIEFILDESCNKLKDIGKISNFLQQLYKVDISSLSLIGITGTNGKTTTAYLTHQLLTKANRSSLYIGTNGISYKSAEIEVSVSNKTTPDIFELYEIIGTYKDDLEFVCLEISSHALDQNRLARIFLDTVCILNIESDHLDYHKDEEEYIKSKFKIFNVPAISFAHEHQFKFLNCDSNLALEHYGANLENFESNNFRRVNLVSKEPEIKYYVGRSLKYKNIDLGNWIKHKPSIFYSIESSKKDILDKERTYSIEIKEEKDYMLTHERPYFMNDQKTDRFSSNLFLDFNNENLVFARICAISAETSNKNYLKTKKQNSKEYKDIKQLINCNMLSLPKGRTDLVKNIDANVVIDYAHNPEAFSVLLTETKRNFKDLVVVFGCGGERDKYKRPTMLKIATNIAAKVIFTSDNSRDEDFKDIFKDASNGNDLKNVFVIEDRKEAIIEGCKLTRKDDCLLILGKGHEETQEVNGNVSYFSDYEVINEIYN